MSYIINEIENFRDDFIDGFIRAYPQMVERIPGAAGVRAKVSGREEGKVAVLIGGGSGHYPAFAGLVGQGIATGAVIGEVFTSPSSEQIFRCAKAIEAGVGVIFSYGNYGGDVMNFDIAAFRLSQEGIRVGTVLVTDDVASAPYDRKNERRGIAGDFCVFKILGGASDANYSLDDVAEIGKRANERTMTLGIAFDGCTLPGSKQPLFSVPRGRLELGLGIHGEPGMRTVETVSAKSMASMLLDPLIAERPNDDGDVVVIVNGLGSTTYEELFVLFSSVSQELERLNITVHHCEVGELVTSLDMAGCSLTLFWLDDDLRELYDTYSMAPAYRRLSK